MLKILRNLSIYKWTVAAVFVLIFLQSMADLFLPTLMADIIDNGVVVGDIPYILKVGSMMLIVTAFGAFSAVGASYFSSKTAMGLPVIFAARFFIMWRPFPCRSLTSLGPRH